MYDSDPAPEFPEDRQLQLYFDHFVKYHKKGRWNRRLTYAGGCPQVNRRDTGHPVPLYPELARSHDPRPPRRRPLDVAVPGQDGRPQRDRLRRQDGLRLRPRGPGPAPVCCPDVPWFLGLKKLMGAFPGRIVCISSATLGVHLWERLPLSTTGHMHALIAGRVRATGVKAEVYPDPSKPFRRPFGRDYRTITPDGILTDWRDQLAYYLDDERQVPDFPTVVRAFIEIVNAEVARARRAITTFDSTAARAGSTS